MGIDQRFGSSTTALQVLDGVDLTGKTAIVTGSNTGIGFEVARSLALHGCHVILACRSLGLANEAVQRIQGEKAESRVEVMHIDLAKLKTVKEFAEKFTNKYGKLDILILNAGVVGVPFTMTEDGYEMLFQVNYLSQAYLTLLLEDSLVKGAPSRVVFVSSSASKYSTLTRENVNEEMISPRKEKYYGLMAYNHSKCLQAVFAWKLSEIWSKKGILVFSAHPGNLIYTDIKRYWWPYRILFTIARPFTKSLQQGASTPVYCATANNLDAISGQYFNNCTSESNKATADPILAEKVWKLTKELLIKAGHDIKMPQL